MLNQPGNSPDSDISWAPALESQFAKVIEASPYGQMLVDNRGIIRLVNPALLKLFGYSEDTLLNQPLTILLPERYRDGHDQLRHSYQQQPSLRAMGLGRDLTGRHQNGTEIPLEIGLNPVVTDQGTYTLAVVTDISERKRLERSLQQAKTHMEEFTYVASHDLKSPLRGIADLVEWVEEDLPENASPALHNNLERIKLRIARMEKLVDDLLLYARAGKHSGDMSPVDLRELIKGIIDLHPVPAGFVVNTHIDLPLITAARTPLETVLRNLFSNAIKHHDGQGEPRLDISVRAYGNNALFSFRDNGPGVPEAAQERIFRLFQTLSNNKQSSGIGLALAKRMSESHGGHIELVCNPGQRGVEFRVYWPRFARKDNVE